MLTKLEEELEEILKNYEQKGKFSEALYHYQNIEQNILKLLESQNIDEQKNANQLLAQCYFRQGNMYRIMGQPKEADNCSKKEIEAARLSGNTITIAQSIFSEGITLISKRQLQQGLQLLDQAKDMFESGQTFDHLQGIGWYWIIKADLANQEITKTSNNESIEYANNALEILLPIENWMGVSRAFEARSIAYNNNGEVILADQDLQKSKEFEARIQ